MDDYYDLTKQMGEDIQTLYDPDGEHHVAFLEDGLNKLAKQHIFFEFLRVDWQDRLDRLRNGKMKNPHKEMFYKEITHIPANMQSWQNEIRNIITKVLDVYSANTPIQGKMSWLYERGVDLSVFEFEPLATRFERVNPSTFTEVLRPASMRDIVDFLLRTTIRQELTFKTCRSCGKYFPNTVHGNSEYCNRIFQNTGKTCKEIGSVKVLQAKMEEHPEHKIYNRAYKSHFARIKFRRMTKVQFQVWAEEARKMRDKVTAGEMTLERYEEWAKL